MSGVPTYQDILDSLALLEIPEKDPWGREIKPNKSARGQPHWADVYRFRQDQQLRSTLRTSHAKYD
jgi:hypothetical protein